MYNNRSRRDITKDLRTQTAKQTHETSRPSKREMAYKVRRIIALALLVAVVLPAIIVFGAMQWNGRQYYIIASLIIVISLLPFFILFERRKPKAREIVLIAVLTSLAVAGRAAFVMLPNFKPSLAIVIIAGAALGCEAGLISGALTALVSNIMFGQGPWTPWQMFAFGVVGFFAGVLFNTSNELSMLKKYLICAFGFFAAFFIYGAIMDASSVFMFGSELSLAAFIAMYASSLIFNLTHAVSTLFFLFLLCNPVLRMLNRIKVKYGMLDKA